MKTTKFITWIGCLLMFIISINSCTDKLDGTTFFTSDDMTIIETLEANPELFSSYSAILEKTEFSTALESYGSYTCFAPTNAAIKAYLEEKFNVSSVDELNSEEQLDFLKILVKFHTLPSNRGTNSFIEGRIVDTTYTGDYLTSSYLLGGGISDVVINREAKLNQYDIATTNGVIHALDAVLDPYIDGVPKTMENTGKYTIFVEALKQTGYYEAFSVFVSESGSKNNFTILAESDEIYSQEGINSFNDLANLISPDNSDYLDTSNPLNRFVAYHATQNFLYTSDFPEDAFINTVLENNAIKSFKTDKLLKINETETGVDDTWVSLLSDQSNFPAKNGVYHTVDKILHVFVPKAKYIIFDLVSDQPEVQSKLIGKLVNVYPDAFEYIDWFPRTLTSRWNSKSSLTAYNYNILDTSSSLAWIEFVTPVLPKGQYELLVCSNGGNSARGVKQTYWDGEPIGSVYDVRTKAASVGYPDEIEMEANNWRRGSKLFINNAGVSAYDSTSFIRFIITKELLCPVQQRHVIRFETIKSGGVPFDYIEFIPVE
ncbi:fasciclin domain-containing protein [Flavivirga jejuensis]|uniref:Fasciclin domain-containing protein n=1 Tax=Flavivirga jejuensis TaxID=870487 RepID=A0ABT8WKJ2_9FLAO|nr:fasciclin domain-containing protein [Flavivirga jejuensis]MDO5973670.1 fasciclin domain-containing protein [Flavivirga jejuensis]